MFGPRTHVSLQGGECLGSCPSGQDGRHVKERADSEKG